MYKKQFMSINILEIQHFQNNAVTLHNTLHFYPSFVKGMLSKVKQNEKRSED